MDKDITFKLGVDTGNSAKSVEDINKELAETNDLVNEVGDAAKADFKQVEQSSKKAAEAIKTPAARLEELRNRMIETGDAGSVEFQELAREAGALQDEINNVNAAVAAASADFPMLDVGVQALSSIGAAAQAATAAQALFGEENEAITKSIQKLVAIQSLLNAVQTISNTLGDESALGIQLRALRTRTLTAATNAQTGATTTATVAQKVLNAVMNKNPVFLLITAFATLAGIVAGYVLSMEDARTAQELLNEAQDASLESIGEETAKLDDLTNVLKSESATREQKADAIKELNEKYPEFLGNINLETLSQEDLNKAIEQQTELITLQAEAKALSSIKSDLYKEKLELELEAQRALTDESTTFWDVLGHGEIARIRETTERSLRIHQINEEINAVNDNTEANRENQNSLLELSDASKMFTHQVKIMTDAVSASIDEEVKAQEKREQLAAERKKLRDKEIAEQAAADKMEVDRRRLIEEFIVANIKDANVRKLEEMKLQQLAERRQLVAKYGEDTILLAQLEEKQAFELENLREKLATEFEANEKTKEAEKFEKENADKKARLEGELIEMRENFEQTQELKRELAEVELEEALAQEDLLEGEKFKIQQEYAQKISDITQESADRDKEIRNEAINASADIAQQGLNSVQSLSDAVFAIKANNLKKGSKAELDAAKKQFKLNKSLQISSAVISGITGVINTLSAKSVLPEPIGSIQKGITAAALAAGTVANIAKISSTKFDGGGSASVSAPSIPTVSAPQDIGDTSFGEDGTSTLTAGLQGSGTEQTTPSIRVNVVDSDIKASQDNINKVDVISSLG